MSYQDTHFLGKGILPFFKDVVGVFYRLSRLGNGHLNYSKDSSTLYMFVLASKKWMIIHEEKYPIKTKQKEMNK